MISVFGNEIVFCVTRLLLVFYQDLEREKTLLTVQLEEVKKRTRAVSLFCAAVGDPLSLLSFSFFVTCFIGSWKRSLS